MNQQPIALVTGGNRGIGLEVCRQLAQKGFTVLLTARDVTKGEAAAHKLAQTGITVLPRQLDVADPASIDSLHQQVEHEFGRLDVLVNNAAILYDPQNRAATVDLAIVQRALETNTYGPWRMCQAFLPLLRKSQHGRIVNVSSEAGSLARMGAGTPAYNVSKVALNALTRMLAAEVRQDRILVNAICPGWVATEMGGTGGRPVADGAAGIVWAATLPDHGPTGGFFRDGKSLAW